MNSEYFKQLCQTHNCEKHTFLTLLRKYLMELGEHKTYFGTILLKVNDHKLVQICSTGGSNWGKELFVWVRYFAALNSYLF